MAGSLVTRDVQVVRAPVFWFEVCSGLRLLESDYRRRGKEAWAQRIAAARNGLLRELIAGDREVLVQGNLLDAS